MCYATVGNYAKASMSMNTIEKVFSNFGENGTNMNYICALKYYFQAMQNIGEHTKVIDYLKCLFDHDICEIINDIFNDPQKIISKQYNDSNSEKPTTDSPAYIMTEVMNKMRKRQCSNKIDQMNIRNYLK